MLKNLKEIIKLLHVVYLNTMRENILQQLPLDLFLYPINNSRT